MGVNGLLARLSSIAHPIYFPPLNHHFNETQGTDPVAPRVAIDISGWIAASCHGYGSTLLDERHLHHFGRSELLQEKENTNNLLNRQEREAQLILEVTQYIIRKLQLMKHLGMHIFVVLDGAVPPIKRKTVSERKRKRDEAIEACHVVLEPKPTTEQDLHDNNNDNNYDDDDDGASVDSHTDNQTRIRAAKRAGAQTFQLYSKIIQHVLEELRRQQVPFMVAPYESDGQLAFLSQQGLIDWVFSEDSDMIGHGVHSLVYKLEELHSVLDKKDDASLCLDTKIAAGKLARGLLIQRNEYGASTCKFSLQGFTDVMIVVMIVAAGCDYCSQLYGIGLVKAKNIVQDEFVNKQNSKKPVLERVLQRLYAESKANSFKPEFQNYTVQFLHALIAFRHPVVFDPVKAECIIKDIDRPDVELMTFKPYADLFQDRSAIEGIVGKVYSQEKAVAVAEGWINPKTNQLWMDEKDIPVSLLDVLQNIKHTVDMENATSESVNMNPKVSIEATSDVATSHERKDKDDLIESPDAFMHHHHHDHHFQTQDERGQIGIYTHVSNLNSATPGKASSADSSSEDSPYRCFTTQALSQSQSSSCTLSAGMFSSISP